MCIPLLPNHHGDGHFTLLIHYTIRVMTTPDSASSQISLRARLTRVLRPGLQLKRWLALFVIGIAMISVALALAVLHLLPQPERTFFSYLTLGFLPFWLRLVLFAGAGGAIALFAVWRIVDRVTLALLPQATARSRALVSALLAADARETRRNGPKVVAIGGGTGMPQLLRGLRAYTDNITAIVTVADDGGSSGVLRQQMGMLPPGDFRNNIAALSEAEDLMTRLFQYRFAERELPRGENSDESSIASGLAGHSFGNLFIATMAAVTGSFEAGISESSRVLAVRGRILPSTLENVTLCAEVQRVDAEGKAEWLIVEGESNLPEAHGVIQRVFLKPEAPRAYPDAVRALLQADLIVASPGSFYTSLLPNLLVPHIRDAIAASRAQRIYICNVATQRGETDGFTVREHVEALQRHAGDAFQVVLANDNYDPVQPIASGVDWVTLPDDPDEIKGMRLFTGDLVEDGTRWRHDSRKLARRLMAVYNQLAAEEADHPLS